MPASADASTCVATLRLLIRYRTAELLSGLLRNRENDVPFLTRKRARRSGRQCAERDWTKSGTHKSLHYEVQRVTESADLAVSALCNRHLEIPYTPTDVCSGDCDGLHVSILELDPVSCGTNGRWSVAANGRHIGALDFGARMGELVRGLTIGGENENSFGHVVEATDISESGFVRDKVEDCPSAPRIRLRREDSGGFVEDNPVEPDRLRDRLVVHGDDILVGVDALSGDGDYAVDLHSARGDELFRSPAGRNSGACERALDAHRFRHQPCALAYGESESAGVASDGESAVMVAPATSSGPLSAAATSAAGIVVDAMLSDDTTFSAASVNPSAATTGGAFGSRSAMASSSARGNSPRCFRSEEHTSELQSPCNLVCR